MSENTTANPQPVSETERIIWLDAEIGQDGECIEFKRTFTRPIEPTARIEDPIDACIGALRENACPFIFVHQPSEALEEIERNRNKRIIFISSGSMGEHIVPQIRAKYINVHSFYIFCAIPAKYTGLVLANLDCLQVFNYETDLLVRLLRDIGKEIIRIGAEKESLGHFQDALDCFNRALNLYKIANEQDKLHPQVLSNIYDLEGRDGLPGRIGIIKERLLQSGQTPRSLPHLTKKKKQASGEAIYSEEYGSCVSEPTEIPLILYDLSMKADEDDETDLAIEAD